jgi:hypothetical protein
MADRFDHAHAEGGISMHKLDAKIVSVGTCAAPYHSTLRLERRLDQRDVRRDKSARSKYAPKSPDRPSKLMLLSARLAAPNYILMD